MNPIRLGTAPRSSSTPPTAKARWSNWAELYRISRDINRAGNYVNCTHCAVAFDRAIGTGVVEPVTGGSWGSIQKVLDHYGARPADLEWAPTSREILDHVRERGSLQGLVLAVHWEEDDRLPSGGCITQTGHAINVVSDGKNAIFVDPQTGGFLTPNILDHDPIFNRFLYFATDRFYRVEADTR
jgi:hypothetical protein